MAEKVAELIAAECPKCGAAAKLDGDRDRGFCQYCGTQIVLAQNKVIHQHFGEGAGTAEAHLKMARTAIAGNNFEAAINYLDSILRMRPDDADAWLMKGEACQRLTVYKTQVRTRPMKDKRGKFVGTETYSEEVATYPRAEEGKAAFRHGIELLEAEMANASDPTPHLHRLVAATARVNGNTEVERYMTSFIQKRPEILYPHEVVVGMRLQRQDYPGVASATRHALRVADGASESPNIRAGRDAVETRIAQLSTAAAAAQEKLKNIQTHQYLAVGLLGIGVIMLFIKPALGFWLAVAGALYYYFGVSKKRTDARNARESQDALAAAWSGA